jgi:hypothetical protein
MSAVITNFTVTNFTATTITATWTVSTPGPIYPFSIAAPAPRVYGPNIGLNGTTYTWTGLTPNTLYKVGLWPSTDQQDTGLVLSDTITTSLVCFAEGTPVTTDQGPVAIELIDPAVNTIDNKRIVSITKGGTTDPNLVLLKKDCLGPNKPSQDTVLTLLHQVLYQGRMLQAQALPNKELIPYTNTPVYNVELETLDTMVVNNLIVETAYPKTPNGSKLQQKNIKCLQPKCQFKRHADIKSNGGTHCCLRCKVDGTHGTFCMKLPV